MLTMNQKMEIKNKIVSVITDAEKIFGRDLDLKKSIKDEQIFTDMFTNSEYICKGKTIKRVSTCNVCEDTYTTVETRKVDVNDYISFVDIVSTFKRGKLQTEFTFKNVTDLNKGIHVPIRVITSTTNDQTLEEVTKYGSRYVLDLGTYYVKEDLTTKISDTNYIEGVRYKTVEISDNKSFKLTLWVDKDGKYKIKSINLYTEFGVINFYNDYKIYVTFYKYEDKMDLHIEFRNITESLEKTAQLVFKNYLKEMIDYASQLIK